MPRLFRPVTGVMRRARFQSLIMVLALAALPLSADTILFSTFSANNPPYSASSWLVGSDTNTEIGVGFTNPFSSPYTLSQIQVADDFYSASNDGGMYDNLNVGLWQSSSDLNSATELESWSVSVSPPLTAEILTLDSTLMPVINPTDFYFITESVTSDPTPPTAEYGWQQNNLSPVQDGYYALLGTGSWVSEADGATPAFSVSGNLVSPSAVPEPRGYAILLAAGFAGFLLLRRRGAASA